MTDAIPSEIEGKPSTFWAYGTALKTEPFAHRPTPLRADGRAGRDVILRHDVVNRAADLAEAAGNDAARTPEAELNEIRVVDVQVEQRAAGKLAVEEELLSPRIRRIDCRLRKYKEVALLKGDPQNSNCYQGL